MNGFGRAFYPSDDYFIGNWKDSKRNGAGKLVYASGKIEEGEFKDNKFIK